MQLWQFNAYCEAYGEKQIDSLSLQLQAAYYEAYWNSATKHKKSLDSVLKSLRKPKKKAKLVPIDLKEVSARFERMEALCKNVTKI